MNFLKNLQSKPEPIKRLIMWVGIFSAMVVIFIFWLMTFPSQITPPPTDKTVDNLKKELPGIWQTLKGQYNNLSSLWEK